MKITMDTLVDRLKHHNPMTILPEKKRFVKAVKFLTKGKLFLDPDILYIGQVSMLSKITLEHHSINLLCLEDVPIPPLYHNNPEFALIVLSKNLELSDVFNEIQDILSESQHFLQSLMPLIDSLALGSGLQRIIDIGYEMLGNPLCIVDMSLKCLALTKDTKMDDDLPWNELVTKGYLSYYSVSFFTRKKLFENVLSSKFPFFYNDNYIKYPRIMGKVSLNNKAIGLIVVVGYERQFNEYDYELVSILCNAVSIELQKEKYLHYTRGRIYEEFIKDLLEGKIKDHKVITDRKIYLNLSLKKYIYILVVDISDFDNKHISLSFSYVQDVLEKIIIGSKTFTYNDNIVMLISYDNEKGFFENDMNNLNEFFKKSNIRGGLSRSFHRIEKMQEYYLQSLEALKLGTRINKKMSLYPYDEYAVYHFADICAGQGDLKKLCHPALFILMKYDRENNTSFVQSLYLYIVNSKSFAETADALRVHRNTIIYRIKKIEEITNVDLNDPNVAFHIFQTYKILEYLNEIKVHRQGDGSSV